MDKPLQKSKKREKKKKHKYLCVTTLLFAVSFLYCVAQRGKPALEYVLAGILVPVTVFSLLFWNNPIKQSRIHKIDAVIAKIAIASCVLYTLFYKFKFGFLLVLCALVFSFYCSNYYSSKEWCCDPHLYWHGAMHVACFAALFYTFS